MFLLVEHDHSLLAEPIPGRLLPKVAAHVRPISAVHIRPFLLVRKQSLIVGLEGSTRLYLSISRVIQIQSYRRPIPSLVHACVFCLVHDRFD